MKSTLKKITLENWWTLVICITTGYPCQIVVGTTLHVSVCLKMFCNQNNCTQCINFIKSLSFSLWKVFHRIMICLFFFTETTSSQTVVVAGSIGAALVFVTIVLILVYFVHRRYTCIFTFKIGNVYSYYHISSCPWTVLLGDSHCLCFHINIFII